MSKKTINFAKPTTLKAPDAESWVNDQKAETLKSKRFTIDVPFDLHRRIKMACAERSINMTDVLRGLLESEFPAHNRKSA